MDDDPDNLDALEHPIAEEGAVVRRAMSGREALALLPGWTPDVLLLDLSMPEMDGYDLLSAIRREPGLRAVPAVAVTGLGYPCDKDCAFSVGFAAHMTKPFDASALIDSVAWLTSKKTSDAE